MSATAPPLSYEAARLTHCLAIKFWRVNGKESHIIKLLFIFVTFCIILRQSSVIALQP